MSLLDIRDLTMSYGDKRLYENAELVLERGEHMGIVGSNGAGKSTLIKIITGEVLPVSGQIKWLNNVKIGYLDQYAELPVEKSLVEFLHSAYADLYKSEGLMTDLYTQYAESGDEKLLNRASRIQDELTAADFYDINSKIDQIMTGLGLDSIGRDHLLGDMSGGQRAKIILAKLLLEDNDVIILDEPTNYLDTAHISWLEGFLQNYQGAAIIISHDFAFLENVTNVIADVAFNTITKYRGSFAKAMAQKEANSERQIKEYQKQQDLIKKTKNFIAKNKARASTSTRAKSREKMLDKMDVIERPDENPNSIFNFPYIESKSTSAVSANNLVVGYQDVAVLKPVSFMINSGEKIAFYGFNGAGKSTLIKTLLGLIPEISGNYDLSPSAVTNYFDQDLIWPDDKLTPLKIIGQKYPNLDDKLIRQRLGAAGIAGENAIKQIGQLSGGEQTKVKLALMELVESNLLILDEPTNHLDAKTKEALARAVQKFEGTAILVSHERDFYQNWIDREINIAEISLQTEGTNQ